MEEQETENLFEKVMKQTSPVWQREQTFRKSRKLRKSKKLDPRRNTPRHIIITLPKMKDKDRILKAAREKERVTYKTYIQDYSTQQNCHLEWKGR